MTSSAQKGTSPKFLIRVKAGDVRPLADIVRLQLNAAELRLITRELSEFLQRGSW